MPFYKLFKITLRNQSFNLLFQHETILNIMSFVLMEQIKYFGGVCVWRHFQSMWILNRIFPFNGCKDFCEGGIQQGCISLKVCHTLSIWLFLIFLGTIIFDRRVIPFERFLIMNLLVKTRRLMPNYIGLVHLYMILYNLFHLQCAFVQ